MSDCICPSHVWSVSRTLWLRIFSYLLTVTNSCVKPSFYRLCWYPSFLLIFTLLSNRSVNFFILQNWNSVPTKQQLPSLPSLQPLALTILISVSIGLTDYFREVISEITQYLSFCDWLVSLHTMTPGFTHFLALGRFAFFEGWIIFQSRYTPRFVYPFICWWTRGFPPPLRCCN